MEATIDFADEDVPVDVTPEVMGLLDGLLESIGTEVDGSGAAERIREGFEVAIIGAPNVGKSTLLNALAGREAAITSEVAGTTRDVIEVKMDLGGLAVTILDTAGLRDTSDQVEALGVALALRRAKQADLRIFIRTQGDSLPDLAPLPEDIVVFGKADLGQPLAGGVSGKTGEGVSDLVGRIGSVLGKRAASAGTVTRERHRVALGHAMVALGQARIALMRDKAMAELVAEDLRSAARALEVLMGRVDVETLLGEIFSSFCIGK
jgi:tRNA modification GTPase